MPKSSTKPELWVHKPKKLVAYKVTAKNAGELAAIMGADSHFVQKFKTRETIVKFFFDHTKPEHMNQSDFLVTVGDRVVQNARGNWGGHYELKRNYKRV